ncbi:MAG: MFS transporter [Chloroflexi bacterium]|nr:MFS transporter [Chloroflexota bacterium]
MILTNLGLPQSSSSRPVFYGWWLVVLAAVVMIAGAVPLFHAMTVWGMALGAHFGWSVVQLGMTLTLTRLVGLAAPAVGYLTDRYGTRRMVLTGLCILAAGFVLFNLIQNLWSLYAAFIIIAAGQSLCGAIPLVVMVSRWFVRRRATAIAILLMAPSLSGFVLVPVIAWSVDPDYGHPGWRLTALMLAGLILLVTVPVLLRLRNQPEDRGLLPYGIPPAAQQVSLSIVRTLRTPAFWLIAFGDAFTSAAVSAVMVYLGLLMSDRGFSLHYTEWVVTAYTGVSVVFMLLGGYLGDRMPKRLLLSFFSLVSATSVLGLIMANSLSMFFAFAVLFGAGFGGRSVLAIAILPDYFGTASLGKILGVSALLAGLLLPIAAHSVGLMLDALGGYAIPFLVLAGLNLLGAFFFLKARPPQPRDNVSSQAAAE